MKRVLSYYVVRGGVRGMEPCGSQQGPMRPRRDRRMRWQAGCSRLIPLRSGAIILLSLARSGVPNRMLEFILKPRLSGSWRPESHGDGDDLKHSCPDGKGSRNNHPNDACDGRRL